MTKAISNMDIHIHEFLSIFIFKDTKWQKKRLLGQTSYSFTLYQEISIIDIALVIINTESFKKKSTFDK